MPALTAPAKILLTGATGYLGLHIAQTLVKAGFHVVGTVRSQVKGDTLVKSLGSNFSYVIVEDVGSPSAFDKVVREGSFDGIVHTASPVVVNAKDPNTVIEPAVKGIENVLKAIATHGPTVKRLVWTGCMTSVYELKDKPYVFTEKDVNQTSVDLVEKLGANAPGADFYRASKVLSERVVWKFIEENKGKINFDISILHPALIWGPLPNEPNLSSIKSLNESLAWFTTILLSKKSVLELEFAWNYVDVRDVAEAHTQALLKEDAGNQRILISAGLADFFQFKTSLREKGIIGIPEPSNPPAPLNESIDNSRSKAVLGLTYRSVEDTVFDTVKSLQKALPGVFKAVEVLNA